MAERNANGQFAKGNTAGKQFSAGNTVAGKYKTEYEAEMLRYFTEHEGYPQFEEFANKIGVTVGTLRNWAESHRRFAAIRERCTDIQRAKLNAGALAGRFDAGYAKFIAVNHHDMRDKMTTEVETVKAFEIAISVIDKESEV